MCILEALGGKVDRLELGDGVLGHACDGRVKRLDLRLVTEAVLQLAKGAEQASTICLQVIPLATQTKLNCEPVALWSRYKKKLMLSEVTIHTLAKLKSVTLGKRISLQSIFECLTNRGQLLYEVVTGSE